jgi:hypothetical protein
MTDNIKTAPPMLLWQLGTRGHKLAKV